jgi:hypothetical protein
MDEVNWILKKRNNFVSKLLEFYEKIILKRKKYKKLFKSMKLWNEFVK